MELTFRGGTSNIDCGPTGYGRDRGTIVIQGRRAPDPAPPEQAQDLLPGGGLGELSAHLVRHWPGTDG